MAGISLNMKRGLEKAPPARFIQNSALEQMEREQGEADAEAKSNEELRDNLSTYLDRLWQEAKSAKETVQKEMIDALTARKGAYTEEKLAEIRQFGGSEIFMKMTGTKCRTLTALLRDILLPHGEDPWDIQPTPIPELPPQVQQALTQQLASEIQELLMAGAEETPELMNELEDRMSDFNEQALQEMKIQAEEASDAMRRLIKDQFEEGGFRDAIREFLDDISTFKNAFLRGPVLRRRWETKWDFATNQLKQEPVLRLEIERRSALNIYPSPNATNLQDGYFFDLYSMTLVDLESMKGVDGYDDDAINSVIEEFGMRGRREIVSHTGTRDRAEGRPNARVHASTTIDAVNFHGPATGALLREWGLNSAVVPDENKAYDIEAWKIGRHVIYARVNANPTGDRGYYTTSFEKIPGSFWGNSLYDTMSDDQAMLNGAARALANNVGLASGPQVAIYDISRLPEGEEITTMHPWKYWQFGPDRSGATGGNTRPIEFFQPDSNAQELMALIEFFSHRADEDTGLPNYTGGSDQNLQGAGNTASGLSMLMGQANKGVKRVIMNIDMDVIERVVKSFYTYNLMHHPDEAVRGDCKVVSRGANALLAKEAKVMRLQEAMAITANAVDMEILTMEGRAMILREYLAELLDIPIEKIMPEPEKFRGAPNPMMPPPEPPPPEAEGPSPVDMAKAETEMTTAANDTRRIELEERRFELERERMALEAEDRDLETRHEAAEAAKAREEAERDREHALEIEAMQAELQLDLKAMDGIGQEAESERARADSQGGIEKADKIMEVLVKMLDRNASSGESVAPLPEIHVHTGGAVSKQIKVNRGAGGIESLDVDERPVAG